MDTGILKQFLEALLMASDRPLTREELFNLLAQQDEKVQRSDVKKGLAALAVECEARGIELKEVASGYRYQTREKFSFLIAQLWQKKPSRYSGALLETLALIAYRQPITRAEIEEVRGVSVGTYMIRLLEEREWIKIVGYKEVPGRPALYATTKNFLDYFNLQSLDELPTLLEMEEVMRMHPELRIEAERGVTEVGGSVAHAHDERADAGHETASALSDAETAGEGGKK